MAKKSNSPIINFFKRIKPIHCLALALVLGIGAFNVYTDTIPHYKQEQREKNINLTFDAWWNETGAKSFEAVGLIPDEKLRNEEFEQYRERYLAQNPSFLVEDRIKDMPTEFRNWWELKGGKEEFIKETKIYPTEREFQQEQRKWIKSYTNKYPRYHLAFVPKDGNYVQLLTSWILFPGLVSVLIFAVMFMFSYCILIKRWGIAITSGCFLGMAFIGGVFVQILTLTSFFDHFEDSRYMGCSLAVGFLLGACCFSPRKNNISNSVVAFAMIGMFGDMAANWILYPGIFNAVAALTPAAFAFGGFAGMRIPEKTKSQKQIAKEALEERMRQGATPDPISERKSRNRELLESGFAEMKAGRMENAQRVIAQAVSAILQEHPSDAGSAKNIAKQVTSGECFVEFSSLQWLEWGDTAKNKNMPEAALMFLEKGLSKEKKESIARRALYNIGEIRVLRAFDKQEGIRRLEQVINLNGSDVLAIQAKRLIERAQKKVQ